MNALFLDSLIDGGRFQPRRRWTTLVAFALQVVGIGLLVLLPLFYSGALPPVHVEGPAFLLPPGHAAKPHVEIMTVRQAAAPAPLTIHAPGSIPRGIYIPSEPEPAPRIGDVAADIGYLGPDAGTGNGPVGSPNGIGRLIALLPPVTPVRPMLAPPPPPRPRVSTGVSEGLLLDRVPPVYPYPARAARIEGTVVLTAVISSEGRVEQLQVRSGHPFLVKAALEAVREWRYRPYLLNGKPTEVEAQITVAFRLEH